MKSELRKVKSEILGASDRRNPFLSSYITLHSSKRELGYEL
jgi:hypothetical protein